MGAFLGGAGGSERLLSAWDAKLSTLVANGAEVVEGMPVAGPFERPTSIPVAAVQRENGRVMMAQFPFRVICGNQLERTMAASDYIALASAVDQAVFVYDVPVFRTQRVRSEAFQMGLPNGVDEARRLVCLTDACYEAGVPLHLGSNDAEEVDNLFSDLTADAVARHNAEEAVMYARCTSRLTAMASLPDWQTSRHAIPIGES